MTLSRGNGSMRASLRLILLSSLTAAHLISGAHGQDAIIVDDRPRLVPNFFGPADELRGLAFSPDSRQLFAAGFGKVVNTWALRVPREGLPVATYTGDLRWSISRNDRGRINFNSLAVAPTGNLLAMGGSNALGPEGNIALYDTSTRQLLRTLAGHQRPIVSLNFSPSSQRLISVDATGSVRIWSQATDWTSFEVRPGDLQDVPHQPAVFLDEATIATSEVIDKTQIGKSESRWQIVLRDVTSATATIVQRLKADHRNAIRAIVRGDEGIWASADEDGRIYVGRGRAEPRLLRFQKRSPWSLAFGPGKVLAVTNSSLYQRKSIGSSTLELWDTTSAESKSPLFQFELGKALDSYAISISPDKTLLATHDGDASEVLVFRIADAEGKLLRDPLSKPLRLSGRGQRIQRVAFRAKPVEDYQIGISFGRQKDIRKLFRLTPAADQEMPGFSDATDVTAKEWIGEDTFAESWKVRSWLNDSSLAGDRSRFILSNRDGTSETITLTNEQGYFGCHSFIPDAAGKPYAVAIGTRLMNGIFVYALPKAGQSAKLLRYYRDHSGHVTSLSCSADGRYLLSGAEDQTVKIWSLSGLSNRSALARIWGCNFAVRANQLVVAEPVDKAGIAYARGLRSGDVVKSISSFRSGRELRTEAASDLLKLINETPVYHQQTWVLERNGQIVPNSADAEGLGRRPIVAGWEPLLTVCADRFGEWVAFTPDGYFESSVADGGDLFGWQINRRTKKEAWEEVTPRFLKGANLQKDMEKPNVIRQLLRHGNLFDALQAANEPSPADIQEYVASVIGNTPQIQVIQPQAGDVLPADGSTKVVAQVVYPSGRGPEDYSVRATATFRYLGEPTRTLQAAGRSETFTWDAPSHGNSEWLRVTIHENGTGTSRLFSEDSVFVARQESESSKPQAPFALHILGISSEKYAGAYLEELDYAHDDVDEVLQSLTSRQSDFYSIATVIHLKDEEATKENLQLAVARLRESIRSNNESPQMLLVYVAGHGRIINGLYHYFPISVVSGSDQDRLNEGAISWDVLNELTDTGAQTLFMLDTCEAGTVAAQCRPLAQRGGIVLTAASGTSLSLEDPRYKHGVFSWSLLQGLEGQAELIAEGSKSSGSSRAVARDGFRADQVGLKPDKIVTLNELFQFVVDDVPRLTRSSAMGTQTPCYTPKPDLYPDLFATELVRIKSTR